MNGSNELIKKLSCMGAARRRITKAKSLTNVVRVPAIWLFGLYAPLLPTGSGAQPAAPISYPAQLHIDANVPTASDFERYLQRDLTSYFAQTFGAAIRIEYELLRRGPTQTGISYPKYYVWVRIRMPSGVVREGAVRVAAIEEMRFEVTNFLSSEQIRADAESVSSVFPAPLISDILRRAANATIGAKSTRNPTSSPN